MKLQISLIWKGVFDLSEKNLDHDGRWRSKIVSFRMSPEEAKLLDDYVSISGSTKQDYIINRVLNTDVIVKGNIKAYKGLRNRLEDVYNELCRIDKGSDVSEEMISLICFMASILKEIEVNSNE